MILPLSDLRESARAVLCERLVPMHYKDLARAAFIRCGGSETDPDIRSVAEDLREKVLDVGTQGMCYLHRPYYAGALRDWFTPQMTLLNVERIRVADYTLSLGVEAATEAILRAPHIRNKDGSTPRQHATRIAKGLTLEMAVKDWFRKRWPRFYRGPENENDPTQWCGHDFRLLVPPGREITVDVAGERRDGLFGVRSGGKPTADLHVIVTDEDWAVFMHGIEPGERFRQELFTSQQCQPIDRFSVWLNCLDNGYDYGALKASLRRSGAA